MSKFELGRSGNSSADHVKQMDSSNECHDAVDDALEDIVTYVAEQESSSPVHVQPGDSTLASGRSKPVQAAPAHRKVATDVQLAAQDQLWRCSKRSYFHPQATPSAYISQILTDPYFKPVRKPLVSSIGIVRA